MALTSLQTSLLVLADAIKAVRAALVHYEDSGDGRDPAQCIRDIKGALNGEDVTVVLEAVSVTMADLNAVSAVKQAKEKSCPNCRGTGRIHQADCPVCLGSGTVSVTS